jgi:hypothetical protein
MRLLNEALISGAMTLVELTIQADIRSVGTTFLRMLERAEHAVVAGGFTALTAMLFGLAIAHLGRLVADCLIVLIRHARREARLWSRTWHRLRNQLKVRNTDE